MLRLQVERDEGQVRVRLFGDDGRLVAAWEQDDDHCAPAELSRSHDGVVALVVVDDVITAVRLADGRVLARGRAGRGIEASLPLDGRWTLEIAGELTADRGHTGHQGGTVGFFWPGPEPRPDRAAMEAEVARRRAELAAAARAPIRRRLAVRRGTETVVVHEADVSPADGGEVLLWPPIAGPAGVLLRHAIVTDDGMRHEDAPQPPWLVQPDDTVAQLGFELGVSPLLSLDDGRWLLPGADALWRDDYDEPLSILDAAGRIDPLLVGGRPVRVSLVLGEAVPELLATLGPIDPRRDVPWQTVSARVDTAADELLLSIEIRAAEDATTILVVNLSLAGVTPARVIAQLESTPRSQIAVAP